MLVSSRCLCFLYGFFCTQMQRLKVSKSSFCQSLRVEPSLSVTGRKLQNAAQETIARRGARSLWDDNVKWETIKNRWYLNFNIDTVLHLMLRVDKRVLHITPNLWFNLLSAVSQLYSILIVISAITHGKKRATKIAWQPDLLHYLQLCQCTKKLGYLWLFFILVRTRKEAGEGEEKCRKRISML